jgi:chromosomal replication initiator protein
MDEAQKVWQAALGHLSNSFSELDMLRYFGGSEGVSFDQHCLTIALPEGHKSTGVELERNLGVFIKNALIHVTQRKDITFTFTGPTAPIVAPVAAAPMRGGVEQGKEEGLLKHFTFDTFVMGPSNQFPLTMAKYVAQHPGDDANHTNPLFLYGPTGVGKTHLLHAIGNMAREHNPNLRVLYTTCENLMNAYMAQWKENSNEAIQAFQNKFRTPDILLVDDIQYMTNKHGLQNEFFNIFNALKDAQKQIVMTSDRAPAEIPDLVDRLVSRFQSGLTLDIEVPAYETRLNILRMKMVTYPDVVLSNEVLDFIAMRVCSSVRALEGALSTTINYARMKGSAVTVEELEKSLLKTYIAQEEGIMRLSCVDVQRAVCSYYNVRMEDLVGQGRSREVAFPRQVAVFLCRKLTYSSTTEVGKAFNRNHTTVLYSCTTVQNLYKDNDGPTVTALKAILATLGQTTSILNN